MSYLASFVLAVLSAAVGLFAAGSVALLSVEWYHITGREGASGYFVVSIAIIGVIASFVIGLVTARVVAAGAHPGFFRALGLALGIVLALAGTAAAIAWGLADIPPTIDGEALHLAVEVQWPAGQTRSPAEEPGEGYLSLGSVVGPSHTLRASVKGPLWKEDARRVDGRWVVPGAVEIFTTRGRRVLDIGVDTTMLAGFLLDLRKRPSKKDLEWTPWLPAPRPGDAPWPADSIRYRYRVIRRSEPVRIETVGPFEIATIAGSFSEAEYGGRTVIAAAAEFTVTSRGRPVGADSARADAVAVVAGPVPALLIHVPDESGNGRCDLLVGEADRVRVDSFADCLSAVGARPLTSDPVRFRQDRGLPPRGWIDRTTFAEPGLYLLEGMVFDTRRLLLRKFTHSAEVTGVPSVPPLGLSPDERSFVRYGFLEHSGDHPAVVVTDFVADTVYTLPVDYARMRFPRLDALDPAWLAHHFEWKRGPDGIDRLIERKGFVPLPYHGELTTESDGNQSYRIEPAGEALRAALVQFLVDELAAERMPADSTAYEYPVRIGGRVVNVAASGSFGYVMVSMERGNRDEGLVAEIARRFDRALATGKYDALFGQPES